MVKTSPALSVAAPEAQPLVFSVDPVWFAPLTSGVEVVNDPVVWR